MTHRLRDMGITVFIGHDAAHVADCDVVVVGTPVDLLRYVNIDQPAVRVTYDLEEREGEVQLDSLVEAFLARSGVGQE